MNMAQAFINDKGVEIARRRLRQIIELYPTTQSAKDAKTLLNGGFVFPRKMPIEPILPVMPVEPRLILPYPPELEVVKSPRK
jgi:hypothetical protein